MATETVIPEVQKMVNEEIKTVEQEVVPISKDNEEDIEGKSKNEELVIPEASIVVSAEKTEDKEIDPPAVVAVEKVDNVPVLDVEIDAPKATEDVYAAQDVSAVSAPLVGSVEKEPEEQLKIYDAPVAELDQSEDKLVKDVLLTPAPEEVPVTVAEVEAVDKPVEEVPLTSKPDEVPAPVAEVDSVGKPVEEVSLIPEPEEVPARVAEVEAVDKSIEEVHPTFEPEEVPVSESTEVEAKPELTEPQESVTDEITKDAELLVTESPVEKETVKDEEVTVTPDVVKSLVKEAAIEMPKIEEGEEKVVKVETDSEEKKEEVGESKEPATGVAEKSSDGEKTSIDDEVVPEEKKEESVKDVTEASVETSKDIEEKLDAVDIKTTTTAAANEPVEELKELVLEAKAKATVETAVDKLESAANVAEEIAKSDAPPNPESSKDVTDAKTEVDLPKQEIPAKTTPKHSNNIMSKVKQSIVKVKKAIIGKSPSSKTITSDAKDDIQVK